MFMNFFTELRQAKVPVTLKEYLMLMEALDKDVIDHTVEDFYFLSRAALVKDEKNLDKFDKVFGQVFKGLEKVDLGLNSDIPTEWLKALSDRFLTDEEKAQIEAMGGFDKLMEMLAEQHEAAEGKRRRGRAKAKREGRSRPAGRQELAFRRQWLPSRKASASARTRAATARRSRSGTSAITRTSTTPSSSAPATSRWPCVACASSPAQGQPDELDIGRLHQGARPTRAISTW